MDEFSDCCLEFIIYSTIQPSNEIGSQKWTYRIEIRLKVFRN